MSDKRVKYTSVLKKYIPLEYVDMVTDLLLNYRVVFKIVKPRKTKLGDFRAGIREEKHQITVNGDLNKYSFLITTLHEFAHLITTIYTESKLCQCIKLDAIKLGHKQNLIICNTYIPPRQSRYAVEDAFDEIEVEMTRLIDGTNSIILCGDLNAHTAQLDDYIILDPHLVQMEEVALLQMNLPDVLQKIKLPLLRANKDLSRQDGNGLRLLELCKNTGLFIANGRYDEGKPTTTSGTLIDYVLLSSDIANKIVDFKIDDFDPLYSDVHCKIKFSIQAKCKTSTEHLGKKRLKSSVTMNDKIKRWDSEKKDLFINNIKQQANPVIQAIINNPDVSVPEITKSLNSIYINSARQTFGSHKKQSKEKRKKKSFVWYNEKCYQMKKLYNSALRTHRRMKTQASLNLLISISKQYKKQVKKVKKEYSKNLNMHIMQLKKKDPRAYWQL